MATHSSLSPWRLTIPDDMYAALMQHLFPGDHDEHGAVILAGVCESDRGLRLVARELHLAVDGVDYVPGKYGYRMLLARFIQSRILRARDQKLAYLAIHNHGGTNAVGFSSDDFASHERGYPALLDIARGMPVGALVFAPEAVAGDLWFPDRKRAALNSAAIIGKSRIILRPEPAPRCKSDPTFDRQSRMFGDAGQAILAGARVGIIGLGGAGSILAELLGRLGVGEFVLADPDKAEVTNLPRLIAARWTDAVPVSWIPARWRDRFRSFKVDMAKQNIMRANRKARVEAIPRDFLGEDVAAKFKDCDYLFLAADTMGARLLFNALVNQYGVPGVQVGAKIPVSKNGDVGDVFCVSRSVRAGFGCLWCNGLISPSRLQDEAVPESVKQGYAYLDDPGVSAPSVITMNAIACSHAADAFLFHMTGLTNDNAEDGWFRWNSRKGKAGYDMPRKDAVCLECSAIDDSRLGRGDYHPLPTRPKR